MVNRIVASAVLVFSATLAGVAASGSGGWTRAQLLELQSMSIAELEPLPADRTNRVADDPRAADLGERLFSDTRLSANGRVACSTCHKADREFQDGLALARGVGATARRAMPIAGMARSPFLFWDGRKDSLWAQALGPLESPVEHGGSRALYAHLVADSYAKDYEAIFGPLPDLARIALSAGPVVNRDSAAAWHALSDVQRSDVTRVFVNIGKAIAAYERRITFGASRFDHYVAALTSRRPAARIFTTDEEAGLRLFIGKGNCTQCHSGPLLTSNEFHNTGVPKRPELAVDHGRLDGATAVLRDEFNCRSQWSDARERCAELDFMVTGDPALDRAYKVPSLRSVAERAPYMDAGQFATLDEVLDHYNRAPAAAIGHSELHPLRLSAMELGQLKAFLGTLSGPVVVNPLPTGARTQ